MYVPDREADENVVFTGEMLSGYLEESSVTYAAAGAEI
jgi:hypothetical protein